MVQSVHDITATDWQPALGLPGEIVEGFDDISQCIGIILTTIRGSVPLRPRFGSDLWRHQDKPINAIAADLKRDAATAIAENEPRVTIDLVEVFVIDPAVGWVGIRVRWSLKDGGISGQTDVVIE